MIYTIQQTNPEPSNLIELLGTPTSPALDAFGRHRSSTPKTLFDSKLLGDSRVLFWDDQEVSGGSTGSSYSSNASTVTLSVANATAGKRVRQTFQRFNYQPGKSQLVMMTFTLGESATGITREVGYFDDNNGLFLRQDSNGIYFVIRSNVTGTPVDTVIPQNIWNINKLGELDLSKSQILWLDFESLQVGSVRFGFVINGLLHYCHMQIHANMIDVPYFSTPNCPLRYSIENDGTGAANTLDCICNTVISEGGEDETGIIRGASTEGTHVDADVADTLYAVVGIKLKSTHLDNIIKIIGFSMISETNDDFEWQIILNPTIAGTFTYSNVTNSAVQSATGATANTITGGTVLDCGFSKDSSNVNKLQETLRYLGSAIDGTPDEIVLCVRPLTINADIQGSLTWKETS